MATQQDYAPPQGNSIEAAKMLAFLLNASQGQGSSGAESAYGSPEQALTAQSEQQGQQALSDMQQRQAQQEAFNRQQSAQAAQGGQTSGILRQILGGAISHGLNKYIGGKIDTLNAGEELKKQRDYIKAMPKDLTPVQQAAYMQNGPTEDIQKTGNNMFQTMLGNQDSASYLQPKTVMSGVQDQPELQQPMQYNQQTRQFEPIPNTYPIGAKLPYGAPERLTYAKNADVRAENSAVRADINQQQTNDRLDRAFLQQQYTNDLQQWRLNNPNYEANSKQLLEAQRGHKDLVDRANELKAELLNKDNFDRHDLRTNKVLSNKWTALTYSIRAPALQNTGVLNAGEIPQLMNSVADPTAWGVSGFTPTNQIVKQIDALVKTSENGLKNVQGLTTPKTPQPEAPNFYQSPAQPPQQSQQGEKVSSGVYPPNPKPGEAFSTQSGDYVFTGTSWVNPENGEPAPGQGTVNPRRARSNSKPTKTQPVEDPFKGFTPEQKARYIKEYGMPQ
jgi:hypothetical protein